MTMQDIYRDFTYKKEDSVFNIEDIKPFNPKDIGGKTLKMIVDDNEDICMIAGQDVETGIIYLISCNDKN